MLQIIVNDIRFSKEIDQDITINHFLDYIENENINTSGHIITDVAINQNSINIQDNDPTLLLPLKEILFLDIKTKSAIDLAYEAAQALPSYIININEQIILTSELLRNGSNEEGNLKFADTIDTIELFIQLFTGIQSTFKRCLNNYSKSEVIIEQELKLLDIVKSVIAAKGNNDVSMLCDLLEYELVDNLLQWQNKVVPELLEEKI